jgi:hypothetical protein
MPSGGRNGHDHLPTNPELSRVGFFPCRFGTRFGIICVSVKRFWPRFGYQLSRWQVLPNTQCCQNNNASLAKATQFSRGIGCGLPHLDALGCLFGSMLGGTAPRSRSSTRTLASV